MKKKSGHKNLDEIIKKDVVAVFVIMALMSLFHITNTLILARNLSKPQMGLFRMVLTLAQFIFVISLLGMDASFIRFFSRKPPAGYRWRPYLGKVLFFCAIPALILAFTAGSFYDLRGWYIFYLIAAILLSMANRLFTSLLKAKKYFAKATFLERSSSIFFFIFLMIFVAGKGIYLNRVFVAYIVSALLAVALIIFFAFRFLPSGKKPLPRHLASNGFIFFGILVTTIAMLNSSQLFIAKMVSYKALAVYTVILSVMRIFELSMNALYHVFVPSFNNDRPLEAKRTIIFLLLIAFAIGAFYFVLGKPLIHFLFKGKYDEGISLVPFFIGLGIMRILYIFPASIAAG
ncbi:MAG: oligosaccharide flippase family protein, partial [Candidatus Omnitrophica bacterium]|nr:oligosaccharide flippase family protein [Candidatus Omnitrophota bacterium]